MSIRGAVALLTAAAAGVATADDGAVHQIFRYETGFDENGVPLTIPAIDPAGATYHEPTGHVFLADSEIEEIPEVFELIGANVFEVSLAGDVLHAAYDVTPLGNTEPTGIAYSPFDDHFYVTNDHTRLLYRYAFSAESGFSVIDSVSTLETAGADDPEGVTVDPATGIIYVLEESARLIVSYSWDEVAGFTLLEIVDMTATFPPGAAPNAPEGIAFDPESGHLFMVSHFLTDQTMYECTTAGELLVTYDLDEMAPPGISLQGLTVVPTDSSLGGPPWGLLAVDGGIDNDQDPTERDGAVSLVEVNRPPRIDPTADATADEAAMVSLDFTASDLDPEDALSWSLIGPVAAGASIDGATGAFAWVPGEEHGPGSRLFTVHVTDDATPALTDRLGVVISVNEVNEPPALEPIGDQSVEPGETVSFVAEATDPDLLPALGGGLVAAWPFDTVFRSTTGAHDGAPAGDIAISTEPGDFVVGGGALTFDGIDDSVAYDPVSLPGDFTAAAWVLPLNIDEGPSSEAVVFGDTANTDWIRMETFGVRIKFNDDRRFVETEPDFVNGQWQHLAVVRSDGEVAVYRNGQLAGSLEHPEPFTPELLGRKEPVTDRYDGLLDDVALWDRPLDGDEIALLYDGGGGRAVNDAGTVAADEVAYGLAGDLPDGATIDAGTGAFSWTTPGSGTWTFSVQAADDAEPPAVDEETITITAAIPCSADIDGDGAVGVTDFLELLAAWGPADGHPADIDGDGVVGVEDMLALLAAWGPCPE